LLRLTSHYRKDVNYKEGQMRWWIVPLTAIGLAHNAGATEFYSEIPRGSIVPLTAIGLTQSTGATEFYSENLRGSFVPTDSLSRMGPPSPPKPSPGKTTQPSKLAPSHAQPVPFVIGAHAGGGLSTVNYSEPFGISVLGDKVRSPGFLGGGQIGYNWHAPSSLWVFGLEADISGLSSDGTNTCLAASASAINTSCQVRPQVVGTFTGHIGYAMGPSGRTLLYGTGGLGRANDNADMALNAGGFPALTNFSSQSVTSGSERELTPAWLLQAEYDYLGLGSRSVANVGSFTCIYVSGGCITTAAVPPALSGVTQNIQQFKVGLNYNFGVNPLAGWPTVPPVKAPPMLSAGL
jgi:opacity protein-like surface antigen